MGKIRTLLRFARSGVSRLNRSYVLRYPNVRAGKFRPFLHWLFVGIFRGNKYFPKIRPFIGQDSIGFRFGNNIQRLEVLELQNINETPLKISSIPSYIIDELNEISLYEPAILAPGRNSIPWLPVLDTLDLEARTGLVPEKLNDLGPQPETIVLVPHFVIGGADHYTANLVQGLMKLGLGPVQVIATLPHADFDQKKLSKEIIDAYGGVEIVIWSQLATHGSDNPLVLASYLHATGATRLINIQSDLGFRVFSKYGKALSQKSKLFSAFFSMDTSVFSKQYGAVYFRSVSKSSTVFSDNHKTVAILKELNPSAELEVLPTIIPESKQPFPPNGNLSSNGGVKQTRLIWISRLERAKGTDILGKIAQLMPHVQIDVFGPLQTESIAELGLSSSNLTYRGQIESIFEMDYSRYSAFIFTSQTEGNPLIVLEIAAMGLPIVSTAVGDLSSTFTDNEIDFVDPSLTPEGQALEFVGYVNDITQLEDVDREVRIERAASAVKSKHSEKKVITEIRRIFEINT